MAVSFDWGVAGADNSSSWSHITGSGSYRVLVVGVVSGEVNKIITSITYNSLPMTKHPDFPPWIGNGSVWIYYMVDPPEGSHTIQINWVSAPTNYFRGSSASFSGADPNIPFGTIVKEYAYTAAMFDVVVASKSGDLVCDFVGAVSSGTAGTLTVGGGQTTICNTGIPGGGGGNPGVAMSYEDGAVSVTMSWTPSSAVYIHHAGIPINQNNPIAGRIVAYTDDLASDDRRLLDINGNQLQPWEIRADAWVRYAGWAPVTSEAFSSLVDDPTCGYIEEVSWDSESDVATTTTSRMDLGEIIIARASAQSTG